MSKGLPRTTGVDLHRALGFPSPAKSDPATRHGVLRYLNLQLLASGLPGIDGGATGLDALADGLLASYREKSRILKSYRCPADRRIEEFLNEHFRDLELERPLRVPAPTFVLDRHGLARELSIPAHGDRFENEFVDSYRVDNGVLHNPRSDRRTTEGTFHVVDGGLPVPPAKKAVPRETFVRLFRHAARPGAELLRLPVTANQTDQARSFVSLLLRPTVCPQVRGWTPEKSMEIRFFVPGSLVSNLDFVESIFGNAGDPFLPENDAALDVEHWTGHTGCVIVAPHLVRLTKKELGLPRRDQASPRQQSDGMCWEREDELYNDGVAFKLTCRTAEGVMVTLIADNYYGYCKKEVKTQISYAANLFGNVEEEHAGGALAFRSFSLGDQYSANTLKYNGRTFADVARDYATWIDVRPEGYGVDRWDPRLVYVPEQTDFDAYNQTVSWVHEGTSHSLTLLLGHVFMLPSGFHVHLQKHPSAPSWRLIGTLGEGTFCHKPCTVSGGGKSEISKPLSDYMIYGQFYVADLDSDLERVDEIFRRDYSRRWKPNTGPDYSGRPSRPLLSPDRSLGSVIKLLTPSPTEYNDAYNRWLESIPNYIYALVFIIKRFYKPEWGEEWRQYFGVDIVNGFPGHELKYGDRKLVASYLRVGWLSPVAWRTFKVRQDFAPSAKVQMEDDISVSVVVPADALHGLDPEYGSPSVKMVKNCEYRLFQRPDDAVHRGLDKQTESDLSRPGNFISNFEPLDVPTVRRMIRHVVEMDSFTGPMKRFLRRGARKESGYLVCSSNPRLVNGKPTKNPRYLQDRPDLVRAFDSHVAEMGTRLSRAVPADRPVHWPVNAVLFGRRNNPPDRDGGIRGLAVYNPLHYQELPELFMDFIASLTGRSPSTTGAGSEGALTKGPFNALRPVVDLNNALVSAILTGLHGFSSPAGYIGPSVRIDHDISLLVPEIWCRLRPEEREPDFLIANGYLEKLEDFEHGGLRVVASRLGYRITERFVRAFFGRIFDNPNKVFDEAILEPESQGLEDFADGIQAIAEAQAGVARRYIDDGSVEEACPPLQALIRIMAEGHCEGRDVHDPAVRHLFTRDALLESDWYGARLERKQQTDVLLWRRHLAYLDEFVEQAAQSRDLARLGIAGRRELARRELARVSAPEYLERLRGTLGADLLGPYPPVRL